MATNPAPRWILERDGSYTQTWPDGTVHTLQAAKRGAKLDGYRDGERVLKNVTISEGFVLFAHLRATQEARNAR